MPIAHGKNMAQFTTVRVTKTSSSFNYLKRAISEFDAEDGPLAKKGEGGRKKRWAPKKSAVSVGGGKRGRKKGRFRASCFNSME